MSCILYIIIALPHIILILCYMFLLKFLISYFVVYCSSFPYRMSPSSSYLSSSYHINPTCFYPDFLSHILCFIVLLSHIIRTLRLLICFFTLSDFISSYPASTFHSTPSLFPTAVCYHLDSLFSYLYFLMPYGVCFFLPLNFLH